MQKIRLSGHIKVPSEDLKTVLEALPNHIALTHKEKGCLIFSVKRNIKKDTIHQHHFDVYEEFIDQASFDKHQARVKASKWGEVTKNVERFYTVTKSKTLKAL